MPSATVTYPAGVFGYTGAQPAGGGNLAESWVASGPISLGAAVELDGSNPGRVKAATAASAARYVGAAMDAAAAAGDVVQVATQGVAQVLVAPGTYTEGTNLQGGGAGGIYQTIALAAIVGHATPVGTQTVSGSNALINVRLYRI